MSEHPNKHRLGQIAFEEYVKARKGIAVHGDVIPNWEELGVLIQAAWEMAAMIVLKTFDESMVNCDNCRWWHKTHVVEGIHDVGIEIQRSESTDGGI